MTSRPREGYRTNVLLLGMHTRLRFASMIRRTNHPRGPISSVSWRQVETAWGRRPTGPYQGIAQDLADFPFADVLGLSSYPYLGGFADPEAIPLDYYSRIPQGTTLPVLVVEGGWPSVSVGSVVSSPAEEARYITRQERLLDSARAKGVFQLTFYDLDLRGFPPQPPGSILPLFTHLGLADSAMHAKPALAVWDGVFRRPR